MKITAENIEALMISSLNEVRPNDDATRDALWMSSAVLQLGIIAVKTSEHLPDAVSLRGIMIVGIMAGIRLERAMRETLELERMAQT